MPLFELIRHAVRGAIQLVEGVAQAVLGRFRRAAALGLRVLQLLLEGVALAFERLELLLRLFARLAVPDSVFFRSSASFLSSPRTLASRGASTGARAPLTGRSLSPSHAAAASASAASTSQVGSRFMGGGPYAASGLRDYAARLALFLAAFAATAVAGAGVEFDASGLLERLHW